MSKLVDKFYNAFGGLDTRTNSLQMDPNTARSGTKNNRYNFKNQHQKANGMQHKALDGFTSVGEVEYRFTDIDSGEAKLEILAVGTDGNLYKKSWHRLKFTGLGAATTYSFYYDSVLDTHVFKLNSYVAITVSLVMTMDQLRAAIVAQGAVCVVVDDDGATVTSSKLAYLQDVTIDSSLSIRTVDATGSWFYGIVSYPSQGTTDTVPFITTSTLNASSSYEGISYVNLNNVCYITDGGFPMKYDGKQVYAAGMPKVLAPGLSTLNYSGFALVPALSGAGALSVGTKYEYLFRYAYVDAKGSKVYGSYDLGSSSDYMNATLGVSKNVIAITYNQFEANYNFPVFACRVNGDQNIPTAGGTINVASGHNIKVGMTLRIPVSNAMTGSPGFSYINSKVTAVAATTITLASGLTGAYAPFPFNRSVSFVGLINTLNGNMTNISVTIPNCSYTNGSTIVTAIPSTAIIVVGDYVSGSLPTDSFVTEIISSTSVRMSAAATSTVVGNLFLYSGRRAAVGDYVVGSNVAIGTTVLSHSVAPGFIGRNLTMSATSTADITSEYTFYESISLVMNNQVLNAGYPEAVVENTISSVNTVNPNVPEIQLGAFMEVYRRATSTGLFYKAIDLPIRNVRTDLVYIDYYAESSMSNLAFVDAEAGGELPRACKYLGVWQGTLVQGGRPVNPNITNAFYPSSPPATWVNSWGSTDTSYLSYKYTEANLCDYQSIYWADPATPEGFPQDGLHEFLIKSANNDNLTGFIQNKDALFAFKEQTTSVLTGSLAENDISMEILESDVGCVSHRSIQDVGGYAIWLDGSNGFYACAAGRLPEAIGYKISDYQKNNTQGLNYKTAVAANFRNLSMYICSVGSNTFVYDYALTGDGKRRNAWYLWDRINVKSILATSDGQLLMFDGTYTWKMKVTNTKYDFTDHTTAIDMVYNTAWLNKGAPTIDKTWVNLWINSVDGDFTLEFSQCGNYMDTAISTLPNVSVPALSATKTAVKIGFKSSSAKLSGTSFGMRNNVKNEFVRIDGYEVEVSPNYDSGEPKR